MSENIRAYYGIPVAEWLRLLEGWYHLTGALRRVTDGRRA